MAAKGAKITFGRLDWFASKYPANVRLKAVSDGAQHHVLPAANLGKRLIFWDFARASWQYDVVVGLILIFIFFTPRAWFHDQPKEASVVLMSTVHGTNRVFIATELLENVPDAERPARAAKLIHGRTGKNWNVVRVEPIRDESAQEIKGFIAYTAPRF